MNGFLLPFAAIGAGVVSATSPCVLPVLPGYLASVSVNDPKQVGARFRPSILGAFGFVAGFTIIFVLLGATASALGSLLFTRLDVALDIAGGMLIILGLHQIGLLQWLAVVRERRPVSLESVGTGPRRSILLGAVFALGWTPCIGPILATILTKAASDASLSEGLGLLLLYSAGLGAPFIMIAVWFDRSARIRRWLIRRALRIQRLGGLLMIAIGIGYVTGGWSTVFSGLQNWLARTGWPPI